MNARGRIVVGTTPSAAAEIKALCGTWAGRGVGGDELLAERRRERELEERKARRWPRDG